MIETARLQLVPCTLQHFEASLHGNEALSKALGVTVPSGWTEFPEMIIIAYDKLKNDPSMLGWFFYLIIHKADNKLIGTGGFKGKPDKNGTVEIGYEIAEEYREQGYATEMVGAFIRFAFHHQYIHKVVAHTLEEYDSSVKVLQKNGMQFAGNIDTPGKDTLWKWEITRNAYESRNK